MDEKVKSVVLHLKTYFMERDDIAFSYIFGSRAAGTAVDESDFDIAAYFYPENGELQIETEAVFPQEDTVWREIENITETETDFIVLNRAPAIVAASLFYSGIPIYIDNHHLKWRFFLSVTSLAEEYRNFARDFVTIKKRSTSLSETDKDRLLRIMDFLESELDDRPSFEQFDKTMYFKDSAFRRNIERWIENLVNASIDLGKIIISSAKQNVPQTYRETLLRLGSIPPFSETEAETLAGFVKLRNVLAHEYLDMKYKQIRSFIDTAPDAYCVLVNKVKEMLSQ